MTQYKYFNDDRFASVSMDLDRLNYRADSGGSSELNRAVIDASTASLGAATEHRADSSAFAGNALGSARELTYFSEKILDQTLTRLITENSISTYQVGAGIKRLNVQRSATEGYADLIGVSGSTPILTATGVEEEFKIEYYGIGYTLGVAELDAMRHQSIKVEQISIRGCVRALKEAMERNFWRGHEEAGIYGVLNYPYLTRQTSTQVFSAKEAAANPQNLYAALTSAADFPADNSDGSVAPNTMYISQRLHTVIKNAKWSTGASTDTTILEQFRKVNPNITDVVIVAHLRNITGEAGGSLDGVFFAHNGVVNINGERPGGQGLQMLVGAPATWLPLQREGFNVLHPLYGSFGGCVMEEALANNLLIVEYRNES